MTPRRSRRCGPGHRRRRDLAAPRGLTQQVKARLQGRRGSGPLQPYRELRRLWGKSGVAVEGTTVVYLLAPLLVAAASEQRSCSSQRRTRRQDLASATSSRPGRSPRPRPARDLRCRLGHLERVCSPRGEPRPDAVGVRRGCARPLALGCGARRRHDRPPRHRRGHRRRPTLDDAGAWAGSGRFRTRRGCRDGTSAGRQPRYSSRADNDPRGACARVRGPRPGPAPVGARCPPLARARAGGLDLPAPSPAGLVGSSRPPDRAHPSVFLLAVVETLVAKMRILLVPRLIGVGAAIALLGIVTWLVDAL